MTGSNDLGDFLRSRRERLRPEDVGMPSGGRRRTPGLRREEIAMLAMLSADYYARLEQGRAGSPSDAALASLARAMRLNEDEQRHLFHLAGQRAPARFSSLAHVDPSMQYLLDALHNTPAQVCDDLLTVIAQNRAAESLLGTWAGLPRYESNVTWRWFADPSSRERNHRSEHERIGRAYAADLRAGLATHPVDDAFARGMVADLLARSDEFRTVWDEHTVAPLSSAPKRILHPHVGELDFQCDVVLSPATGHRLVLFRPRSGTDTFEKIDFLAVLGRQTFD